MKKIALITLCFAATATMHASAAKTTNNASSYQPIRVNCPKTCQQYNDWIKAGPQSMILDMSVCPELDCQGPEREAASTSPDTPKKKPPRHTD